MNSMSFVHCVIISFAICSVSFVSSVAKKRLPLNVSRSVDSLSDSISLAPPHCPIDSSNLLYVSLFLNRKECFNLCVENDKCFYYSFFDTNTDEVPGGEESEVERQSPSKCFLFESCDRLVHVASSTCSINEENVLQVYAYVPNIRQCRNKCQKDAECAYFRHFKWRNGGDDKNDVLGRVSFNHKRSRLLTSSAEEEEETSSSLVGSNMINSLNLCFMMRSCTKRHVTKAKCTLGRNNHIEMRQFIKSDRECLEICEQKSGCHYFYWYPIDDDLKPQQCYLFRQCAPGDEQPTVAMIIGGRHPGLEMMTNFQRVISRDAICDFTAEWENLSHDLNLIRAGAVAGHLKLNDGSESTSTVLYCGGMSSNRQLMDSCLALDVAKQVWSKHSVLNRKRYKSASASVGSTQMYIIGGWGESSVEGFNINSDKNDEGDEEASVWKLGPELPTPIWGACAVATPSSSLIVIGGMVKESTQVTEETHHDPSNNELTADDTVKNTISNTEAEKRSLLIGPEGERKSSKVYQLSGDRERNGGVNGQWEEISNMKTPRSDHACLFVELEGVEGILVTGGLDNENRVLDSTEFYNIKTNTWSDGGNLKYPRTGHSMELVYGLPTVIGGLGNNKFLSNIEKYDKKHLLRWTTLGMNREWTVHYKSLTSPRYDMASVSFPHSVTKCQKDVGSTIEI